VPSLPSGSDRLVWCDRPRCRRSVLRRSPPSRRWLGVPRQPPLDALRASLVDQSRRSCAGEVAPRSAHIPFVGVTWLCFEGREPRLSGALPGGGGTFTAADLTISDDLRSLQFSDMRLLVGERGDIRLRVRDAHVAGLSPWGRASTCSRRCAQVCSRRRECAWLGSFRFTFFRTRFRIDSSRSCSAGWVRWPLFWCFRISSSATTLRGRTRGFRRLVSRRWPRRPRRRVTELVVGGTGGASDPESEAGRIHPTGRTCRTAWLAPTPPVFGVVRSRSAIAAVSAG